MGATGETPFFDGDGTFAPQSRDSFSDPMSGLIAAAEPRPLYGTNQGFDHAHIAGPVQPAADAVRKMVNAALLEDGRDFRPAVPIQPVAPLSASGSLTTSEQPLGMLPQQRNWPSRPPQLLRRSKPRFAPPAEAEYEDVEDVHEAEEEVMPRRMPGTVRGRRPSQSSIGVILAVVLMLVFAVVAIEMLISLFGGIAGLFH